VFALPQNAAVVISSYSLYNPFIYFGLYGILA
jgi:hypothetical protein